MNECKKPSWRRPDWTTGREDWFSAASTIKELSFELEFISCASEQKLRSFLGFTRHHSSTEGLDGTPAGRKTETQTISNTASDNDNIHALHSNATIVLRNLRILPGTWDLVSRGCLFSYILWVSVIGIMSFSRTPSIIASMSCIECTPTSRGQTR